MTGIFIIEKKRPKTKQESKQKSLTCFTNHLARIEIELL